MPIDCYSSDMNQVLLQLVSIIVENVTNGIGTGIQKENSFTARSSKLCSLHIYIVKLRKSKMPPRIMHENELN